jgi:hypothetical protein
VRYFRKHHGPVTALAARAILSAGLLLRWAGVWLPRARRGEAPGPARASQARTCAAGLGIVWAS